MVRQNNLMMRFHLGKNKEESAPADGGAVNISEVCAVNDKPSAQISFSARSEKLSKFQSLFIKDESGLRKY